MMLNNYNVKMFSYKNKDILFNFISEEDFYPTFEFNFADVVTALADIFIDLEKIQGIVMSNDIFGRITRLKEAYYLYQSYRFNYLRNDNEESKLLSKVNNY